MMMTTTGTKRMAAIGSAPKMFCNRNTSRGVGKHNRIIVFFPFVRNFENMDELSVSEILTGLVTKEYQEHRLALLQHLTNCFAENPTVASGLELKNVFKTLLVLLTTTLGTDDDKRNQINTSVTALVNSTTSEDNVQTFLEVLSETMDKELYSEKFRRCISNFLDHNPQLEDESSKGKDDDYWASNDEWQHVGNLLCNLAQLEDGRKIVLQQSTGYMERLVVQVSKQYHHLLVVVVLLFIRQCLRCRFVATTRPVAEVQWEPSAAAYLMNLCTGGCFMKSEF